MPAPLPPLTPEQIAAWHAELAVKRTRARLIHLLFLLDLRFETEDIEKLVAEVCKYGMGERQICYIGDEGKARAARAEAWLSRVESLR
jgi:hypothetical protein